MGILSTAAGLSELKRITQADMPPPGELQLELPRGTAFVALTVRATPTMEPELLPYQVRPSALAPGVGNGKISLGVGRGPVAKSSHGAVYRVTGATEDREHVEVLAIQLVSWLNYPNRVSMTPQLVGAGVELARIVLTPTGRREGFLAP